LSNTDQSSKNITYDDLYYCNKKYAYDGASIYCVDNCAVGYKDYGYGFC
jgi:hypothetical protein